MSNNIHNSASLLRRKAGEASIHAFAKHYLSNHINILPSDAHIEIYDMLYDMAINRGKKLAIAAPRDFGKSTMITLAYIIYLICYTKEHFIVIISNTASQACKILDNVRNELIENEALRRDFPEIFESKGRPKPPRWKDNDIITRNNIEIVALGYGQQIRGSKHRHYRPTLVVMDDLEAGENTFSYETKEKMKLWLESSIMRLGSDKTNFLFIGTVHNSFSLLGEYLSSEAAPSWTGKKYKAVKEWPKRMDLWEHCWKIRCGKETYNDAKGQEAAKQYYQDHSIAMEEGAITLWPQKWSLFYLMEMNMENDLSFQSEMQNEPIDTDKMSFDIDTFSYWDLEYPTVDALLRDLGNRVSFYGACDPALGRGGDYTAIIVLAKYQDDYYVIVADIARKTPDNTIKDILAYTKRYQFCEFAVETDNFQELVAINLKEEAMAQGISINLIWLKSSGIRKRNRILSLYPWVKNGSVKFCKSDKLLLEQFRMFPKGDYDDGPDALAMAMKICCGQRQGELDIYDTEKKDACSDSEYFYGWDLGDREFLGFDDDEDGPSPNSREIDIL